MFSVHPKLIKSLVEQTPRAMIAMLIVSSAYVGIFLTFIPAAILVIWFVFQILLATYRFYNSKMFSKYLEKNDQEQIEKHEFYFIISNLFQAFMWTVSSVLSVIYAPQPFELVSLIIIIGVITAAALSMSSLYKAYLIFFFAMIIPQLVILFYFGEHQHFAIAILAFIYTPTIILLSRAIYSNRLANILAHDDLQKSVNELHQLSMIDVLTNIYNRRYFFEIAKNLTSIATREQKPLSLLMIDIDYFKKINDNYGHQAGDFVLVNLVKEIEKSMRTSDVFARIGGEEFSILLDDTSIDGAKIIAEKIRHNVENKTFNFNNMTISITISIGMSELSRENTLIEDLYKKADKQLYLAKKTGRNKVCL